MGWAGAVLCGGAGRRMGRDKALLLVDGQPMVRRAATALGEAGADRVLAIGGDPSLIAEALGLSAVGVQPDEVLGQGPLAGILAALAALDSEIVLVVACDLLRPSPEAMAATVAALAEDDRADLAAPVTGDQTQWLHAAWRRRAHPLLAERFAAGERAIHRAVSIAGLVLRPVSGVPADALADADTPADLPQVPRRDASQASRAARAPGRRAEK